MKRIRNNRRILGAAVLTILCVVGAASPAAAFEREEASIEAQVFSRVSALWGRLQSLAAYAIGQFGDAWLGESGARVED